METVVSSGQMLPGAIGHGFAPADDTVDEYYYGCRTIIGQDDEGKSVFSYRALTLDDFLDPEEGDVYTQGNLHEKDVSRLRGIFRHYLRKYGNMTVYSDLKIEWGIEDMSNPAPDISVIADVRDPEKPRDTFYVPEEGVKPFFILEVVSPIYRKADIEKKPEIYRRAGVSEYIIVDPGLEDNEISYTVSGYRLIGNRYVKMPPDDRKRIYSRTTDVWVGASESGDRLIVYDGKTDGEILSDGERAEAETKARMQEKTRADKAETRAGKAETRAGKAETRADKAEEELRRLRAKLGAVGISAD